MTEEIDVLTRITVHDVEKLDSHHKEFIKDVTKFCALSCNDSSQKNFDKKTAEHKASNGLKALEETNGIKEMLAAQMLSIHQMQQQSMALAHRSKNSEHIKYFINTSIKLANCFAQQANILSKLQGHLNHEVTVGHVNVHPGGQAIVGTINGCSSNTKKNENDPIQSIKTI